MAWRHGRVCVLVFVAIGLDARIAQCKNAPYTTLLGEAEVLGGPTAENFDSPFHYFKLRKSNGEGTRLVGYNNNGDSYRVLDGDSLDALVPGPQSLGGLGTSVGLNRSADPTAKDHCGCWLQAVADIPSDPVGVVHGFYHEEYNCDYAHNSFTNKSIAYAISTDGGVTFTKAGWPNNQIIQPCGSNTTATAARGQQIGEGDHSIVTTNQWIYLFFLEWDVDAGKPVRVGLARSNVSTGGVPGSWNKYLCQQNFVEECGFVSDGVGGNSSALANISGSAVTQRNASQNEYISVGSLGTWLDPYTFGHGPRLSYAWPDNIDDPPIEWIPSPEPLIFADGESWVRSNTSFELIAYPSIVAFNETLYLYYTYLFPGTSFTERYFVRRRIEIIKGQSGVSHRYNSVSLTLYQGPQRGTHQRKGDWWATTAVMRNASTFSKVSVIGGILGSGGDGRQRLLDCYIIDWDDHMIGFEHECTPGQLQYGNQGQIEGIRTLGFSMNETEAAAANSAGFMTTLIYRCFNNVTLNHGVSTDKTCSDRGGITEFPLGYIIQDETLAADI